MSDVTKTITSARRNGLKARIEKLLTENQTRDYSVHEIGAALGVPKTENSQICSALCKLPVRSVMGPAVGSLGRRYTKRYRIVPKPAPIVVREVDMRRELALIR